METVEIPKDHPLKLGSEEVLLAKTTLKKIEIDSIERGGLDEEAITNIVMASKLSELGKVRLMFRAVLKLSQRV